MAEFEYGPVDVYLIAFPGSRLAERLERLSLIHI